MMNDSNPAGGRPPAPPAPSANCIRSAAAIIATAAVAMLAAACGGSPSSAGSASSSTAPARSALAFSLCVRAHGVPGYPDPASGGGIPKRTPQQLGVSYSRLLAAQAACQHLLPNTGNIDDNPVALHQWWSLMRRFARCMHSRGVPNWPDPSPYPPDPVRPTFNLHAAGIGFHLGSQPGNIVNSPLIQAKVQQCDSVVHSDVSGWFD